MTVLIELLPMAVGQPFVVAARDGHFAVLVPLLAGTVQFARDVRLQQAEAAVARNDPVGSMTGASALTEVSHQTHFRVSFMVFGASMLTVRCGGAGARAGACGV